jgi:hypothetical protein
MAINVQKNREICDTKWRHFKNEPKKSCPVFNRAAFFYNSLGKIISCMTQVVSKLPRGWNYVQPPWENY